MHALKYIHTHIYYGGQMFYSVHGEILDWLALHLKFGSVCIYQLGGISRHHVDQLQI